MTRGVRSGLPWAGRLDVRLVDLEELRDRGELAQSAFWGRYKARFGMTPRAFAFSGEILGTLLSLVRPVGVGASLAYVPYGPQIASVPATPERRASFLRELAEGMSRFLPAGTLFVRFDLPWEREGAQTASPRRLGVEHAAACGRVLAPRVEIQPAHTVLLDLRRSDDELLAAMHHKTRYNIRLSGRRGVRVYRVGPGELHQAVDRWYDIKLESDRRDGIVTHSREYYQALFVEAGSSGSTGTVRQGRPPQMMLLLAEVEGRVAGGIILSFCGDQARYLHGASASFGRSTMFSYALQWEAMRLAREAGCTTYDLYGIPPNDDPRHPMHGLYRFKTGFGGRVVHRLGCHDVPLRPLFYRGARAAEEVRQFYFKKVRRWGTPRHGPRSRGSA